jgi:ADP-dependent NAD(P)H-hydrate dehydratase / NAD(P)H-hydrate epimerase
LINSQGREKSLAVDNKNLPKLGKNDTIITEELVKPWLPQRSFGTHKWEVGGLVIVAGAPNFVGAPLLCASAAARSGAGVVLLAVPRSIVGPIATRLPEAVFLPIPEGDPQTFASRGRELILERLEKSKALVIGPGLGQDQHATALMALLFGQGGAARTTGIGFSSQAPTKGEETGPVRVAGGEIPAVIDADGLTWLAKQPDWWANCRPNSLVLTPHVGEMSSLLECESKDVIADPIGAAKSAAAKWKQTVVLKYGHSVATDGAQAYVSPDAPVSLATAGAGDVLAGMIGGLLAQGVAPLAAAATALYVGPKAARHVEQVTGSRGLLAGDLPLAVAEEFRILEQSKGA